MRRRRVKETLPTSSPSSPTPREQEPWDAQSTYAIGTATAEKVGIKKGPQKPKMVMIRTGSNESTRLGHPQDALHEKSAVLPVVQQSFLDGSSTPSAFPPHLPLHSYNNSRASSVVVPSFGTFSPSYSRGTRDQTVTSKSDAYANANAHDSAPRKETSPTGPNISRFSWTNYSQEPPTPRYALERQSVATSTRSSLARFRKVDSWVNNQTGRINSVLLRGQPDVPRLPDDVTVRAPQPRQPRQTKAWKTVLKDDSDEDSEDRQTLVAPSQQEVQTQAPVKEQHFRQVSDATVFRQHPGTMLSGLRNSIVPSEDLDRRVPPSGSF